MRRAHYESTEPIAVDYIKRYGSINATEFANLLGLEHAKAQRRLRNYCDMGRIKVIDTVRTRVGRTMLVYGLPDGGPDVETSLKRHRPPTQIVAADVSELPRIPTLGELVGMLAECVSRSGGNGFAQMV